MNALYVDKSGTRKCAVKNITMVCGEDVKPNFSVAFEGSKTAEVIAPNLVATIDHLLTDTAPILPMLIVSAKDRQFKSFLPKRTRKPRVVKTKK